jgi:hypothetical protein
MLLESQPVAVKALCAAADKALFDHLPWPYAPKGQPVNRHANLTP